MDEYINGLRKAQEIISKEMDGTKTIDPMIIWGMSKAMLIIGQEIAIQKHQKSAKQFNIKLDLEDLETIENIALLLNKLMTIAQIYSPDCAEQLKVDYAISQYAIKQLLKQAKIK